MEQSTSRSKCASHQKIKKKHFWMCWKGFAHLKSVRSVLMWVNNNRAGSPSHKAIAMHFVNLLKSVPQEIIFAKRSPQLCCYSRQQPILVLRWLQENLIRQTGNETISEFCFKVPKQTLNSSTESREELIWLYLVRVICFFLEEVKNSSGKIYFIPFIAMVL